MPLSVYRELCAGFQAVTVPGLLSSLFIRRTANRLDALQTKPTDCVENGTLRIKMTIDRENDTLRTIPINYE